MKHFIGRVVSAGDAHKRDGPLRKHNNLPGAARLVALVGHHAPIALVQRGLYTIAVRALVAVPEQQAHRADDKRLRQLHQYAAAAELVARVARVPVVVLVVAVDQCVLAPANALEHERRLAYGGHVVLRHNQLV
ncbi:hypothetical protein BpHYR1_048791 [Brachionus plicatilis]|uniref:Uncharacterized protein n=1 Tax=Brachionus plicatilis TaxID=10195 RepID=A0A3M7QH94_BRAPC|nr:hypothetical protein BpHYR1_048791 [Brachionus plicatilis]